MSLNHISSGQIQTLYREYRSTSKGVSVHELYPVDIQMMPRTETAEHTRKDWECLMTSSALEYSRHQRKSPLHITA